MKYNHEGTGGGPNQKTTITMGAHNWRCGGGGDIRRSWGERPEGRGGGAREK